MNEDIGESSRRYASVATSALIVVLGVVILRNAWVGDDAYITFRTVDNFVNGYGLTWNVAERVQSFTHPLWTLVLATVYYFTSELYFTSIFFSLALTLAAVIVLARKVSKSIGSASLAIVILISSKSFIDYSASGLENPLTFLILVLFGLVYFSGQGNSKRLLLLSLLAGFGMLNRMDTILLFLPGLSYAFWQVRGKKSLVNLLIGFSPVIVWELFSLLYYGFPFPNTYYAKLQTGLPKSELMVQGLLYYLDSLNLDPLTLVVMLVGLLMVLASRSRSKQALYAGVLLYLGYIVMIGGDFMTGRFFAAPLLLSVILISRIDLRPAGNLVWALMAGVLLLALTTPHPHLLITDRYGQGEEGFTGGRGVADEKGWYYQSTGLLMARRGLELPRHPWAELGRTLREDSIKVYEFTSVGFMGYEAGPGVHLIDEYALCDPLLARLPLSDPGKWRIGHFERTVPRGYSQTLESGDNVIANRDLSEYYRHLSVLTRGDIFSWDRLVEIWKFNIGSYDYLLDNFQSDTSASINYARFTQAVAPHSLWNADENVILQQSGSLQIWFESLTLESEIEISLDDNDVYQIVFMRGETELASVRIEPLGGAGMRVDTLTVPTAALLEGYDRIRIFPLEGDGKYSIGHLRLLGSDSSVPESANSTIE